MWIELRADGAAHNANWLQIDGGTNNCAADEIAMPADIFRQRIKRQIGAVLEGRLEHGPEECVVATDQRTRWRLDKDHGDTSISHGALGGKANAFLVESVSKADTSNAEWRK